MALDIACRRWQIIYGLKNWMGWWRNEWEPLLFSFSVSFHSCSDPMLLWLSGILLCIFRAEAVSKAATSSFMMTFSSLVKIYLFSVLILIAIWSETFEFKLFYSKLQMTRHPHSFINIIKKEFFKILPLVWERRHKLLGEILKEETDRTGSILKARLHLGLDYARELWKRHTNWKTRPLDGRALGLCM